MPGHNKQTLFRLSRDSRFDDMTLQMNEVLQPCVIFLTLTAEFPDT